MADGFRHVRIQLGGYGAGHLSKRPDFREAGFGAPDDQHMDAAPYARAIPRMFEHVRKECGEEIQLLHDIHDFVRVHISQAGGLSRAMKIARLAEWFNVRTAWHGPSNVSPVGHAVNAHIDLAIWNFGIQEVVPFGDETREVFAGCPTVKNGYLYVNEAPGHGVDINESAAAKFPVPDGHVSWWKQIRRSDGTSVRP